MLAKLVLAAFIYNMQLSQIHRNSVYYGFIIPPVIGGGQ